MKTRFTCRIVRTLGVLHEASVAGHVSHCADCQAVTRQSAAFESALRRDAAVLQPNVSTFLDTRILNAVRRDQRENNVSARRAPRRPVAWWAAAGVAAALAAGVFVTQRPASPGSAEQREATATSQGDAQALLASVGAISIRLADTVIPSAGTFIADNPLQTEINAVYTDAQLAIDFLALNFLPKSQAVAMRGAVSPQ